MSISLPYLKKFSRKENDKPGILTPIEDFDIAMKIKRIFYIYGFNDVQEKMNISRGLHGHYNAKQVIICVHGSCTVRVSNKNGYHARHVLDSPTGGLVLPTGNMIEMSEFSLDAVLLVICDKNYKDDKIFS